MALDSNYHGKVGNGLTNYHQAFINIDKKSPWILDQDFSVSWQLNPVLNHCYSPTKIVT